MVRSLKIAGVERWKDYIGDSLDIKLGLTSEINTASFKVRGVQPSEGEEVIIEDSGIGRMFAGIITKVTMEEKMPGANVAVWKCECDDYTFTLNKRLAVEVYEGYSADQIIIDLINKYGNGEFTTNGVRTGAPTVEKLVFDYVPIAEAFKKVAEYVNWEWDIDFYKDIQFFDPMEKQEEAPMTLTPGGYFRKFTHSVNTRGLRNRVYVRGGKTLSDPWTYEIVADGKARAWVLPHKPHNLSMTVSGSPVTVGIENVHDPEDYDVLMNYHEKRVVATDNLTTPVDGATLAFTYQYGIDVITMVEDTASQEELKKVQGGDGVYEHVIINEQLDSIEAAEVAAKNDIIEHGNPVVQGTFETEVPGWKPGQLVTVNLPERGVENTFLVRKVTVKPMTNTKWTYKVTYGGKLLGIADYLKAIYSKTQEKDLAETETLHKFIYWDETALIKDELLLTFKELPWLVEESYNKVQRQEEIKLIEDFAKIINPDFEYGTTEGWEHDGIGSRVKFVTTEDSYSGKYSLKLNGTGSGGMWSKPIPCKAGDVIRASCVAKGKIHFGCAWLDENFSRFAYNWFAEATYSSWTKIPEAELTAPAGTKYFRIWLYTDEPTYSTFYDDVEVWLNGRSIIEGNYEGISTGDGVQKVVCYGTDGYSYSKWVSNPGIIATTLEGYGWKAKNAQETAEFMKNYLRQGDAKGACVLFMGTVPDTVVETVDANCTARKFLDAGGRIIWIGDWQFYYVEHSDGTRTSYGAQGSTDILGFTAIFDTNSTLVTITSNGTTWGLSDNTGWVGNKPISTANADIVLATNVNSNASGWVTFFDAENAGGFVRVFDCSMSLNSTQIQDLDELADYNFTSYGVPFVREYVKTFDLSEVGTAETAKISWNAMANDFIKHEFTDIGKYVVYSSGDPTLSFLTEDGIDFMRVSGGQYWAYYDELVPFDPTKLYVIRARVRQVTDPTSGGSKCYVGVNGVLADGKTPINIFGDNTINSQHYVAAEWVTLTAGEGWREFIGYIKGHGTPAGRQHNDPNDPAKMYPGTTFIQPMFIVNYSEGNGTADIDFEILEFPGEVEVQTNLSLDGGTSWQGWTTATNGATINGIGQGIDLSNAKLQVRVKMNTDLLVSPVLESLTVEVEKEQSGIPAVGSQLKVWSLDNEWPYPEYCTSEDNVTFTDWTPIEPGEVVEVPYPGYYKVRSQGKIEFRNYKKAWDETDAVVGSVVVGV